VELEEVEEEGEEEIAREENSEIKGIAEELNEGDDGVEVIGPGGSTEATEDGKGVDDGRT
jgi:hypothetical protein